MHYPATWENSSQYLSTQIMNIEQNKNHQTKFIYNKHATSETKWTRHKN